MSARVGGAGTGGAIGVGGTNPIVVTGADVGMGVLTVGEGVTVGRVVEGGVVVSLFVMTISDGMIKSLSVTVLNEKFLQRYIILLL